MEKKDKSAPDIDELLSKSSRLRSLNGIEDFSTLLAMLHSSVALMNSERPLEARPILEEILASSYLRSDRRSNLLAQANHNLAKLFSSLGDRQKAIYYGEVALQLYSDFYQRFTEVIIETMTFLSVQYTFVGDVQNRIRISEKRAVACSAFYGEGNIKTAIAYARLGVLYNEVGNYAAASAAFEHELGSVIETDGSDSRRAVIAMTRISEAYWDAGRLDEAEKVATEAYEIAKRTINRGDPVRVHLTRLHDKHQRKRACRRLRSLFPVH